MRGGDLYKAKSPSNKSVEARSPSGRAKIPPKSRRRLKDEKTYSQHCKELEQEIREKNNGRIYCYFSGFEIKGTATWHHLHKRDGSYYTDKEWLVPCMNEYHLDYHFKSVGWLMQQPWYNGFLARLKDKSKELYDKEVRKYEKSLEIDF